LSRSCSIDTNTLRNWEQASSLPKDYQLKKLGLGIPLSAARINELLTRYGYAKFYPLDPEDYVDLYALNRFFQGDDFPLDLSPAIYSERLKERFPRRFFLRLLWRDQLQAIKSCTEELKGTLDNEAFANLCGIPFRRLRNWMAGMYCPSRKEIFQLCTRLELHQEDLLLLLESYYKPGRSSREQTALDKACLPSYQGGKEQSFLFPSVRDCYPERYGEGSASAGPETVDQATLNFLHQANHSRDEQTLIVYFASHYQTPHMKVCDLLQRYLNIWQTMGNNSDGRCDLADFYSYYGIQNSFSMAWSNLRNHGVLPSRAFLVFLGILLEMEVPEINVLLNCSHYSPLNEQKPVELALICASDAYFLMLQTRYPAYYRKRKQKVLDYVSDFFETAGETALAESYQVELTAASAPDFSDEPDLQDGQIAYIREVFRGCFSETDQQQIKDDPLVRYIMSGDEYDNE
jgi:hypothetical protein